MGKNLKVSEAYISIKNLLLNHELHPGQSIVCRVLEEKLSMSRTPIINALNRLEQEGFLVSRANTGFYVRETSLEEIAELFEIREKLEGAAIDFLPRDLTKRDLKPLKAILDTYRQHKSEVYDRVMLQLDIRFHMQLVKLCNKPFFSQLMQEFYENIYFRINTYLLTPSIDQFKKEHEELFNALLNRNFNLAKRVAKQHQNRTQKIYLDRKEK